MAQLSAEDQMRPNIRDSSPLNTLIRRTSSRRTKDKPSNLQLPGTPPRQTGNAAVAPAPPHSPILHTQFRNSTATAASYEDGASIRTVSWDARSATAPSTSSSSPVRPPGHESLASNYDLDSITNRYRDTWRSSGVVDPPEFDRPAVPAIPTVVVSQEPDPPPTHEAWQQEYHGGRTPTHVDNSHWNFSRPVVQPVTDMDWGESEGRKREVLMRNSPHSPTPDRSPPHSPLPSPRTGPSPLSSPSIPGPQTPGYPTNSRPVSPASQHGQYHPPNPYPSPTPSADGPYSSILQAAQTQGPGDSVLHPRVASTASVYSNYSYYSFPPSPTSASATATGFPGSSQPGSPLPQQQQHPPAAHAPTTPMTPATPGRPRAKSSASKHKKDDDVPIAEPKTAQDFLQLGIKHHLENRLPESAIAFEKSATVDGGCGVGMLMWGLAQRHGWGCVQDEATGFKWLRRAAELAVTDLEKPGKQGGDMSAVRSELVLAIYEVGQSFYQGWGVQKDKEMAVQYYRVAARLGDPDAQQELAFCLLNGKGCKKDKKEAAKWYRAAVEQGASDVGLAWIYKDKYQ